MMNYCIIWCYHWFCFGVYETIILGNFRFNQFMQSLVVLSSDLWMLDWLHTGKLGRRARRWISWVPLKGSYLLMHLLLAYTYWCHRKWSLTDSCSVKLNVRRVCAMNSLKLVRIVIPYHYYVWQFSLDITEFGVIFCLQFVRCGILVNFFGFINHYFLVCCTWRTKWKQLLVLSSPHLTAKCKYLYAFHLWSLYLLFFASSSSSLKEMWVVFFLQISAESEETFSKEQHYGFLIPYKNILSIAYRLSVRHMSFPKSFLL